MDKVLFKKSVDCLVTADADGTQAIWLNCKLHKAKESGAWACESGKPLQLLTPLDIMTNSNPLVGCLPCNSIEGISWEDEEPTHLTLELSIYK